MKGLNIFLVIILLAGAAWYFFGSIDTDNTKQRDPNTRNTENERSEQSEEAREDVAIIAENLAIPWDVAFLPDGSLLVTERTGTMLRIGDDETTRIPYESASAGEGGLLGLALHPNFKDNQYVYIYATQQTSGGLTNSVKRYRFNSQLNTLSDETPIIEGIPGANYHDGGRIAYGPDNMLYITTGDAGNVNSAQNTNSLAGKILRVHDDGTIPEDNPFNNAVWSYGHRNPQGLAWDAQGQLWSTEHGRSGIRSGYDELNRIEQGGNYGWPVIQGDETQDGMIPPVLHSGARTTWAPASLTYHNGQLYWGGLRGQSLYQATIEGGTATDLTAHFAEEFGRIRTVTLTPDTDALILTTSNTDGRGDPDAQDDILVRIPLTHLNQ